MQRCMFKLSPSQTWSKFEERTYVARHVLLRIKVLSLDHLLFPTFRACTVLLCLLYLPLPSFSPRTCVSHAPCPKLLRKAVVSYSRYLFCSSTVFNRVWLQPL